MVLVFSLPSATPTGGRRLDHRLRDNSCLVYHPHDHPPCEALLGDFQSKKPREQMAGSVDGTRASMILGSGDGHRSLCQRHTRRSLTPRDRPSPSLPRFIEATRGPSKDIAAGTSGFFTKGARAPEETDVAADPWMSDLLSTFTSLSAFRADPGNLPDHVGRELDRQ